LGNRDYQPKQSFQTMAVLLLQHAFVSNDDINSCRRQTFVRFYFITGVRFLEEWDG
jgi:hypothetical protein